MIVAFRRRGSRRPEQLTQTPSIQIIRCLLEPWCHATLGFLPTPQPKEGFDRDEFTLGAQLSCRMQPPMLFGERERECWAICQERTRGLEQLGLLRDAFFSHAHWIGCRHLDRLSHSARGGARRCVRCGRNLA